MPDVLTHIMLGASVAFLVYGLKIREESMLILLGSALIDIERPLTWILKALEITQPNLTKTFHSIIGAILLAIFAASCFESEYVDYRKRFWLILSGCILHLILDMTMWPWDEHGLYLLYPIKVPFSFHLFWSDFHYYPLLGGAALSIALIVRFAYDWTSDHMMHTGANKQ